MHVAATLGAMGHSILSPAVFLSDSDSPGPVDLDALAALDCRRRTKRPRTAFTSSQLKGLEYYFRHCAYPDGNGRDVITRVTGVEDARIQVWFQNRRARYRKRELPLKKPSVSLTPPPQPPTPRPQLSPPPLTPGTPVSSIDSYYAAVMAYYMQAYQNGHPTYLPLPPGTLPTPPPQTSAMNEQSNWTGSPIKRTLIDLIIFFSLNKFAWTLRLDLCTSDCWHL